MKIYSFLCTRSNQLPKTTSNLLEYFKQCGVIAKPLINQSSIFKAYSNALNDLSVSKDDIIIFCHDDIEILTRPEVFTQLLEENLSKDDTGFVGVAGTRFFPADAVWWNQEFWQGHSGVVYHGKDLSSMGQTLFGPLGQVVVLDGVFLAAKVKTLYDIQMTKPKFFNGEWDFYDIFYTFQTYLKGLKNLTLPIHIRHESVGEIAGRDSWHENRVSFLNRFGTYLPAHITRPNKEKANQE